MSSDRNIRCAIYTRKSSEEGLEQSFNSLDAQREASEAFILSQRAEGWRILPAQYDDGGFSGGTMDRPALKRLLEDVNAGKVDVIVVYKVDRLTRSLADFAKIVEALDRKGVSFVSVTQQFNTTSSMGRLTLNVLLSFAQFEREVTGERIRDKIAASKKKGMWMGGYLPLGYDLRSRKLVPNQKEVAVVCKIFSLYLELGCVSKLAARLAREKVLSKVRITATGTRSGGCAFARGALYDLLRNRLYRGEIGHRGEWYPGEHDAIVPEDLWKKVQAHLTKNLRAHRNKIREQSSSLLTGLIEDTNGNRFTPSFTIKSGRRYRYYVSQVVIKNPGEHRSGIRRIPATEIENLVGGRLRSFFASEGEVFDQLGFHRERPALIPLLRAAKRLSARWTSLGFRDLGILLASLLRRVIISDDHIQILLSRTDLLRLLANAGEPLASEERTREPGAASDLVELKVDAKLKRCGGEVHLVIPSGADLMPARSNSSLLKAVARAHSWYQKVQNGQALGVRSLAGETGLTERYVRKVFACAFLAPDIVETILEGRQPRDLTFAKLTKNIPLSWVEQRQQFGFRARDRA
jgi:DNA invertase Pin-like site-specific DNA recombinase